MFYSTKWTVPPDGPLIGAPVRYKDMTVPPDGPPPFRLADPIKNKEKEQEKAKIADQIDRALGLDMGSKEPSPPYDDCPF